MQNLTGQYLADFFSTTKEQQAKLSVFLDALENAPVEEVKQACADAAKQSATLKVRMSEVRQIWGGMHYADLNLESGIGYNRAADWAREALKAKGITWQGVPIKSKEEKAQSKASAILAGVAGQALAAVHGDISKLPEGIKRVQLDRFMNELKDFIQTTGVKYQLTSADINRCLEDVIVEDQPDDKKHPADKELKAA